MLVRPAVPPFHLGREHVVLIEVPEVENFGWPCFEGDDQQPGYRDANLATCSNLAASQVTRPVYRWEHGGPLAGSGCVNTGSAAAGVAFSDPAGNYPAAYDNGLSSPTTPVAASG